MLLDVLAGIMTPQNEPVRNYSGGCRAKMHENGHTAQCSTATTSQHILPKSLAEQMDGCSWNLDDQL